MPAVAAHYFFGQEVLKLLPEDIKKLIGEHKREFDLGLQGPDILFYYKVWKKNDIVEMGHELHRQTAGTFIAEALENIKRNPSEDAKAYLLGFACHLVLDSTFHGRISDLAASEREHRLLESELDRQAMVKYRGAENKKLKRYRFLEMETGNIEWMRLLYPGLSLEVLRKSAQGIAFLTRLLDSRCPVVKGLISAAEKALHQEGSFSNMRLREDRDKKYFEPAEEILGGIKEAAGSGAEAVRNLYKCLNEECALAGIFAKNFL